MAPERLLSQLFDHARGAQEIIAPFEGAPRFETNPERCI
jgi:hypothetical protein